MMRMRKQRFKTFPFSLLSILAIAVLVGCSASKESTEQYDTLPKLLKYTPPIYPERFLLTQEQARVLLTIRIDEAGDVISASVARSTGDPELDKAALVAVKTWKYSPATKDGKPVPIAIRQQVEFYLRPSESISFYEIVVSRKHLADSLMGLLDLGADFSELARKFSEEPSAVRGGFRETVRYDTLQDVIRIALDRLSPGYHSKPVERNDGKYVILKRKRA